MNIRNVPEELLEKVRKHANFNHLTLRDYVLTRLAKVVGYKGNLHVTGVTYCPSCGRRSSTKSIETTEK